MWLARLGDRLARRLEEDEARAAKGGEGSGAAKLRARKLRADLEVVQGAVEATPAKPKRGRATKPSLGEGDI
jgi:hypothetical protein